MTESSAAKESQREEKMPGSVLILCAEDENRNKIVTTVRKCGLDPLLRSSARLEINSDEAEIINHIYRLYAQSAYSMKKIAHTLNAEGELSPQPQKGRLGRSWCVSSVRHILLNARYTGKTIWNTRRKVRVPGTGKRVFRPRPENEWLERSTSLEDRL